MIGNLILTAKVSFFPGLFTHFPFDKLLITEKKKVIEVNKEFVRQTKAWETWEGQEILAGGWLETLRWSHSLVFFYFLNLIVCYAS